MALRRGTKYPNKDHNPGLYRAEHVATLSYYHSYDPRVVALREDPAVLHVQLVLTIERVRNASSHGYIDATPVGALDAAVVWIDVLG